MHRTIIIGDIHGCALEFKLLVSLLRTTSEDRVVLLGDLIDKGPQPAEVVTFAREIGAETIMGNHEERALRWLAHEEKRALTGKVNPMNVSDEQAAEWRSLSKADVEWLRAAPVTLDLGNGFMAVHGGLLPGVPLDKQKPGTMMRLRYVTPEGKFAALGADLLPPPDAVDWQTKYDGPQSLVVGHAVHSLTSPRVDRFEDGRTIYNIDTGCVFGGHLTALILETGNFMQVKAEKQYASHGDE